MAIDYELDDNSLSEKIIATTQAWQGRFLKADSVEVELPNGHHATHDVIRHPGAVAVIALDDEGYVLLVRQYRTALERVTLEIPAGKLEPGEDALECAKRELEEETGVIANEMRYLAPVAIAAGYCDEIIHLYMAMGLEKTRPNPDPDEFLAIEWVLLEELINTVLDGKIEDSKTIIAALLCDAIRHRL